MATKPIVQPELWASNAVYTTGPFIGSPGKVVPGGPVAAEGHRPGSAFPTPAEYENSQQNRITDLVRWVFLGSSAGAADAHIVETDTSGRATVHGATVDDSADEVALQVIGSGATVPAVEIENTGGGGGVTVDIGNSEVAAFSTATGTGNDATGYEVAMVGTPITGDGFRCTTDAATAAPGVRVEHAGAGIGIQVTHTGSGIGTFINAAGGTAVGLSVFGNTSAVAAQFTGNTGQAAVQATSGSNAAAALAGLGSGSAIGLTGQGGNGSIIASGVEGTAVHADARGVYGRTSVSASSVAAGVRGDGLGAGTSGVHAVSIVGRGLLVQGDTSSPAYPAMRIIPQDDDPSAGTFDGELYWNESHKTLRTCVAGYGYRSMPTMGPGSAFMVCAAQAVNDTDNTGSGFGTYLTALCDIANGTGFYGSGSGAQVLIEFSCDARLTIGPTADWLEVQFVDVTNGGAVIASFSGNVATAVGGFYLGVAQLFWQRTVTVGFKYAPPSDGDLEIRVDIAHFTNVLQVRSGKLTVTGTYN